jgi:hypothetical protein
MNGAGAARRRAARQASQAAHAARTEAKNAMLKT